MMFEIGQIVKFKDAGGTAKVCRIDGDIVYVFDDFGFENAHQTAIVISIMLYIIALSAIVSNIVF